MIVKPYESEEKHHDWQEGGGVVFKEKRQKAPPGDKEHRFISIISRLCAIGGFNETLNIRHPDGRYLPGSDVCDLLKQSLSHHPVVAHTDEFVALLGEAGVTADMIDNDHFKVKLQAGRSMIPGKRYLQPVVTGTIPKAIAPPTPEYGESETCVSPMLLDPPNLKRKHFSTHSQSNIKKSRPDAKRLQDTILKYPIYESDSDSDSDSDSNV